MPWLFPVPQVAVDLQSEISNVYGRLHESRLDTFELTWVARTTANSNPERGKPSCRNTVPVYAQFHLCHPWNIPDPIGCIPEWGLHERESWVVVSAKQIKWFAFRVPLLNTLY